jgi:hypothetical protein
MRASTARRAFLVALLTVLTFVTFSNAPVSAVRPACAWRGPTLPLPTNQLYCSPWTRKVGVDYRTGLVGQGLTFKLWLELYNPPPNARADSAPEEFDLYIDWINFWRDEHDALSGCQTKTWIKVDEPIACAYRNPVNKTAFYVSFEFCLMDRNNRWYSFAGALESVPNRRTGESDTALVLPTPPSGSTPCGPN